jgi:hypothetical protein
MKFFAHAAREPDLRAAFLKVSACNNNNTSLPFFAQPTHIITMGASVGQ